MAKSTHCLLAVRDEGVGVDFKEALAGYLPHREGLRAKQEAQRSAFLNRFPRDSWPQLTLDDYALNTPDYRNSYS